MTPNSESDVSQPGAVSGVVPVGAAPGVADRVRSRRIQLQAGEVARVELVRQSGGQGRVAVTVVFDASEISDVQVSVVDPTRD